MLQHFVADPSVYAYAEVKLAMFIERLEVCSPQTLVPRASFSSLQASFPCGSLLITYACLQHELPANTLTSISCSVFHHNKPPPHPPISPACIHPPGSVGILPPCIRIGGFPHFGRRLWLKTISLPPPHTHTLFLLSHEFEVIIFGSFSRFGDPVSAWGDLFFSISAFLPQTAAMQEQSFEW